MRNERLYKIILAPLVSEKSAIIGDAYNQVVFRVATDATKTEIKTAVEKLFTVVVTKVWVVNVKAKQRTHGRIRGNTKAWRKAYVSLKEGCEIDFLGMGGA